jgi:tRNA(fMet)-specific endonuclease VapC
VDTSVFIAIERGQLSLQEILARTNVEVALSVITASELRHGVERATPPLRRAKRERFVELVLELVPTVTIDLDIARVHARVCAQLAGLGTPIGAHDAWIAATALCRGDGIATRNLREFERVEGLRVEAW